MYRRKIISILLLVSINAFGQVDLETIRKEILDEGNLLYDNIQKSDLSLSNYKDKLNPTFNLISLMYLDGNKEIVIVFPFDKDSISVLATFQYQNDSLISSDFTKRPKSAEETILEDIYRNSLSAGMMYSEMSGVKNISYWIVIVKDEFGFTSYFLTKPLQGDIIPIGNDFKNNYNKKGKWKNFDNIHNNYIPISINTPDDSEKANKTFHTHSYPNTQFITATDICILKLYSKKTKFKKHYVVSKKYISEYDLEKDELTIMTREEFKRKPGNEKIQF